MAFPFHLEKTSVQCMVTQFSAINSISKKKTKQEKQNTYVYG